MPNQPKRFSLKAPTKRVRLTTSGDYSGGWRKLRERRLAEEPLCRVCKARGHVTPATQVDHIIPKVLGGRDEWDNTQSICEPCHRAKTKAENARRRGN